MKRLQSKAGVLPDRPRCGTCHFAEPDPEFKGEGQCHRCPPATVPCGPKMDGTTGYGSHYPQVDLRDDWCGEHIRKR